MTRAVLLPRTTTGAESFPDVLGALVERSVTRLAPALPLGALAPASTSGLIRAAESDLVTRLSRLESAVSGVQPLVPSQTTQLRGCIARLDADLASLHGASGAELLRGTQRVAATLGDLARQAERLGSQHSKALQEIRRALEQRRDALARLASGRAPDGRASSSEHARLDALVQHVPSLHPLLPSRAAEPKHLANTVTRLVEDARRSGHEPRRRAWFASSPLALATAVTNPASLLGAVAAGAAARRTGEFLESLQTKTTGVVGAVHGRVRRGVSSIGPVVGQGAKTLAGALLAINPATAPLAAMHGVAKKLTPLAKVAWEKAKQPAAQVAGFLRSPGGQLVTSALSVAATFVPGGLVVKAGIGALMGAVEAVSKGGGLKEALMGATAGALEGALPFVPGGAIRRLALGAVKGGLQATVNGGDAWGIARGALFGAAGAGGGEFVKQFGRGRAVRAIDRFVLGERQHAGVLGQVQKLSRHGALQRLYGKGRFHAPALSRAVLWGHVRSGQLASALNKASTGGELVRGGLEAVGHVSGWAATGLDDGRLKRALERTGNLSRRGARALEPALELVEAAHRYSKKAHTYLGVGVAVLDAPTEEALRRMRNEQRRRRRKKPDERGDTFVLDRIDDWFYERQRQLRNSRNKVAGRARKRLGTVRSALDRNPRTRALVRDGVWTSELVGELHHVLDLGVKGGARVQAGLKNLVLATENADPEQWGGALRWLNETASTWDERIGMGMSVTKQMRGVMGLGHFALGGTPMALVAAPAGEQQALTRLEQWREKLAKNATALKSHHAGAGAHPGDASEASRGNAVLRLLGAKHESYELKKDWKAYKKRQEAPRPDALRAALTANIDQVAARESDDARQAEKRLQSELGRAAETLTSAPGVTTDLLVDAGGHDPELDALWEAVERRRHRVDGVVAEQLRGSIAPLAARLEALRPRAMADPSLRESFERLEQTVLELRLGLSPVDPPEPLRPDAPLGLLLLPDEDYVGSGAAARPLWELLTPRVSIAVERPSPRDELPALRAGMLAPPGGALVDRVAGGSDPVREKRRSGPILGVPDSIETPRRLDFGVMSQMERFLGARLSHVRIHTGKAAELITRRFDAEAVTIREHVFFAPGRFQPATLDGRRLIAHELTHVLQRGRPNLDTRTAEEEAHRAEAAFGTPGMEVLDLSVPEPDFRLPPENASRASSDVRTARRDRTREPLTHPEEEAVSGEELLDLVGERVYELMCEELENEGF